MATWGGKPRFDSARITCSNRSEWINARASLRLGGSCIFSNVHTVHALARVRECIDNRQQQSDHDTENLTSAKTMYKCLTYMT